MWSRWIRRGAFDGQPCAPVELARYLVEAQREQVAGRERLDEALRTHVRAALRSGDVSRINTALTHIEVCARAGAPIAGALVREAHAATGSAEWHGVGRPRARGGRTHAHRGRAGRGRDRATHRVGDLRRRLTERSSGPGPRTSRPVRRPT